MISVEDGDSDPLDDGYGYGTRLYTGGRAEGLSESCDTSTVGQGWDGDLKDLKVMKKGRE